jgi:gamma-glutamylcyclotransferase (GGCT)/AIG2-like uncharacterized protein YtfP
MNTSSDYLFVYGTLRRGLNHPMHQVLVSHAEFTGGAVFQGRLYNIGQFPGAVYSERPQDLVHGEVYRLQPSAPVLQQLDHYEGCTGLQGARPLFRRERRQVMLRGGAVISAWIYLYNRPTDYLQLIPSGDYLGLYEVEK